MARTATAYLAASLGAARVAADDEHEVRSQQSRVSNREYGLRWAKSEKNIYEIVPKVESERKLNRIWCELTQRKQEVQC